MNRVIVVYNKKSGSALPAHKLRTLFVSAGFDVVKMISVSDTFARDIAPYVKKDMRIAAVGGDGTISAVVQQVSGSKAIIVPIPGGTLNNFTKDLGVEQDIEKAIMNAGNGIVKQIDVASVNGTYFMNNSSIGVYPRSLAIREQTQKHFGKWPAALYGVMRALIRFRTYRVTIDGKTFLTPFVFVGNNDYQLERGGLGNRTKLNSGKLCVYIVNSPRRWTLVKMFFGSLFGRLRADKELIMSRPSSIVIESSRRRIRVSYDGEVALYAPPLEYTLHAGKLNVLV